MGIFDFRKIKKTSYEDDNIIEDEYVELNVENILEGNENKITIKPFSLTDFSDVKPILDALREGYTICLINIKPLKEKDLVELKRSINKIKKTVDAIEGDIAGFGEDYVVATPSFARIYRNEEEEI